MEVLLPFGFGAWEVVLRQQHVASAAMTLDPRP